ncbi:MAG: magnesium transporter CorA family protein [Vulcanimicrobiaceae bacterium]
MDQAPRCVVFKNGATGVPLEDLNEISQVIEQPGAGVWLDLVDPSPQMVELLKQEFGFHPLALEDATLPHERPKADEYPDYWLLVTHGISGTAENFVTHEIAIFASHRYVVTIRQFPPYPLDDVERRWLREGGNVRHESAGLVYLLLDTMVDGYSKVASGFAGRVAEIEEMLFAGDHQPQEFLREVFSIRNDSMRLRRSIAPMREILNTIIHSPNDIFQPQEIAYYRDIRDHAVHALEELDATRDAAASALDMQFRLESQRQNDVVKQLTVIATIFLPLTFVTGFFGQNFGWMVSRIDSLKTFAIFGIALELAIAGGLLAWFKVKRWL